MSRIRAPWAAVGLAAALTWILGATPVFAHHSFGLYDMSKMSEIEGTVLKLEWSNPHCWLFITSTSQAGAQTPYGFEMASVGEVVRRGWTKTALKTGDRVRVTYHPIKDGRHAGYMVAVMTADGHYVGRAPGEQNGQDARQ